MNSPGKRQVIRLGALPAPPKLKPEDAPVDTAAILDVEEESPKTRRWVVFVSVTLAVVVLLLVVVLGSLAASGNLTDASSTEDPNANVPGSGDKVTFAPTGPTVPGTFRPTSSPVHAPTASPHGPTTYRPTLAPTAAPTLSPQGGCINPDAFCGCDLTGVKPPDVVFLIDESASVGSANYALMKNAVIQFAANVSPPMEPLNGARIGYIEFGDAANEVIDLKTSPDNATFAAGVGACTFANGRTNHSAALFALQQMLERQGNLRSDAQLSVVMITDGVPCFDFRNSLCPSKQFLPGVGNNDCCKESFQVNGGTKLLAELGEQYNFTFFFLPINPKDSNNVANFTQYDGILPSERYLNFPNVSFNELSTFLGGQSFEVVLDPCVDPPAFSSSDRLLLQAEADLIWDIEDSGDSDAASKISRILA